MADTSPTPLGPGDFVKVTYHGRTRQRLDGTRWYDDQTPYTFLWDSRPYVAPVDRETFVPFEAASVALGDPRASDLTRPTRDAAGNTMWVVDRPTEVRRLAVLYDNATDDDGTVVFAPRATVTNLDGNPVVMVLDDPAGESVLPAAPTILDRDQLLAQVQRQQRMIEQLAEAQGIDIDVATATPEPDAAKVASGDTDPFTDLPEG